MTVRHPLSAVIAVLGAAYMAAAAFGWWLPNADYPFIGERLYDVYARMLLDGRLDLPVRELRFEGHYTPDGTGYMYHGLGPLLTRLPFIPFVDLPTTWLAALSIWFWAVVGNLCCHRAFGLALDRAEIATKGAGGAFRALLALAVWFASPGVLLVANGSVFYEPIAMAYGLGSAFVLLIAMASFGALSPERALPWLAVVAGLMVHARPHLAVGLYAGVCLMAVFVVRRGGARNWRRAGLAMLLLGLFGGLLLAFNAARFNDVGVMHGSFARSELQYGTAFWGIENASGRRAEAFEEHGRFNAGRIPTNLLFYAAAPPRNEATRPVVAFLQSLQDRVASLGYIRIEEPRAGILFLWPIWVLLMAVGLRRKELWRMPALAGAVAVFVGALLMLSYATITLRYHVDLWPALALPAIFGVGPLAARMVSPAGSRLLKVVVPVLVVVGLGMGTELSLATRTRLIEGSAVNARRWSFEHCVERAERRGLSPERSRDICLVGFPVPPEK